jgi:hypothetical protein
LKHRDHGGKGHILEAQDVALTRIIARSGKQSAKMAVGAGITRRHVIFGGIILSVLWLWIAHDRESAFPTQILWNTRPGGHLADPELDVFDFPPVDSDEIRSICEDTQWNKTLVFTCDNNHGGVGQVRNTILNCVRYAISAGGSLVLPQIAPRMDEEVHDDHGRPPHIDRRHGLARVGLEYMFDKNHFVDSLKLSCPQLNLIRHMEQTVNDRRRGLTPETLFENVPISGIEHPDQWPGRLAVWIDKYMAREPHQEPIIIDLDPSFLHYPTHSDGHKVAHTFGNILKFRSDVRRLATKILKQMDEWYNLYLDFDMPIIKPSFFGVHLMTEDPLIEQRHNVDIMYSHYQTLSKAYLEHALEVHTPVMYVASGNISEVHKLALQATEYKLAVTHKEDLLKMGDMEELEMLRWDQRALVDYLVLLKAQEFAGVGHSIFSWNIALKRHDSGDHQVGALDGDIWSDGLSSLYGVRQSFVESSECMWS